MPKIPYPYEVNGKLVAGNGSFIPICSLSNRSLLPSLAVLRKSTRACGRGQISSNTNNLSNFFLGNLGAVTLERYVKVMIEENDSNEAYNAIVFTNGLKHVDTAEELAVLAGENLIFEKLQKQTLNSMFSSSSKWKML
jgi:hypothetical protein